MMNVYVSFLFYRFISKDGQKQQPEKGYKIAPDASTPGAKG
jgi:hypothetical protein